MNDADNYPPAYHIPFLDNSWSSTYGGYSVGASTTSLPNNQQTEIVTVSINIELPKRNISKQVELNYFNKNRAEILKIIQEFEQNLENAVFILSEQIENANEHKPRRKEDKPWDAVQDYSE